MLQHDQKCSRVPPLSLFNGLSLAFLLSVFILGLYLGMGQRSAVAPVALASPQMTAITYGGVKYGLQGLHLPGQRARKSPMVPSCIRGCREEAGWSMLVSTGVLLPLFHVFHCLSLCLSPGPC